MENWGLSVFVEQKLLLDAEVSSSSYQMELTMVVVHEICHQWFGDLVTPVWWEDVWLKEGFAHFFEYVGTDFLFPKWNMITNRRFEAVDVEMRAQRKDVGLLEERTVEIEEWKPEIQEILTASLDQQIKLQEKLTDLEGRLDLIRHSQLLVN
ncbi:hypothetical protein CRUP_013316 [Coryphaenoides rupestris]|nr:hypothetical protein CRUP_013316 [Coryphaenoides rupestris]